MTPSGDTPAQAAVRAAVHAMGLQIESIDPNPCAVAPQAVVFDQTTGRRYLWPGCMRWVGNPPWVTSVATVESRGAGEKGSRGEREQGRKGEAEKKQLTLF